MALKTTISVQLRVNSVSGAERGRGRGKKGEKEHPLVLHSICFLLCWSLGLMVMSDANWNLSLEGKCQLGRTDGCYRNLAPEEGYTLHSSTPKPALSVLTLGGREGRGANLILAWLCLTPSGPEIPQGGHKSTFAPQKKNWQTQSSLVTWVWCLFHHPL